MTDASKPENAATDSLELSFKIGSVVDDTSTNTEAGDPLTQDDVFVVNVTELVMDGPAVNALGGAFSQLEIAANNNGKESLQIKEKGKKIPFLQGPPSHRDLVLDGQPQGYSFSAPTGSYGEKSNNENNASPVVPDLERVITSSSVPIPNFSDLLSESQKYERDQLLALRDTPDLINIWKHNYQDIFEADFPQLIKVVDCEALDDGQPDDVEEATLVLRGYQHEFAERGLRGENDIILLPTGSGKTYIVIEIIRQHLADRIASHDAKVIFLAPTQDLVSQQLKLIRRYVDRDKCRAISGDDNLTAELVAKFIQGREYLVLAVTPAIIENYFLTSKNASMSNFSLLIFDEMHHTKREHDYNMIVKRYLKALDNGQRPLPQLIGMTATIGIGSKGTCDGARNHILDLCTKYNLISSPWRRELYLSQQPPIQQDIQLVESREDGPTIFIEDQLMATLEDLIIHKLDQSRIKTLVGEAIAKQVPDVVFPERRLSQVYEQYIVSLLRELIELPFTAALQPTLQFCKLALKHLREYYRSLQLIDLLTCKYGFLYLEQMLNSAEFQGVSEVWELFKGNDETLRTIQETADRLSPNKKLTVLTSELRKLFDSKPNSKVIIFVQRRTVAKYLAQYLCEIDEVFLANEFTSIGKSPEDAGMSPQQRLDVRAKFEGSKYNILVATSVLEEGIDIQACILVVRYMYVKDMIAKIQSMGRARHAEGRLLSLLDEKLLEQERENEQKAGLMFEALQQISEMTDEQFQEELRQRRPSLLLEHNSADDLFLQAVNPNIEIRCAICSAFLGFLKDVKVFQRSHHITLDSTIHERVVFKPRRSRTHHWQDGMEETGIMLCGYEGKDGKICNSLVGQVVKMGCGYNFGMWRAKGGISLKLGEEMIEIRKWKDIKNMFRLGTIYIEELSKVGYEYQFVYPPLLAQLTV